MGGARGGAYICLSVSGRVNMLLYLNIVSYPSMCYSKYSSPVEAIKHKASHQGGRVVFGVVQVCLLSYWTVQE